MHEGNRVPAQATIVITPAMPARAGVLLPLPLPQAYDYALPEGVVPKRGMLVRAPLGPREVIGVVWGKPDAAVPAEKVKLAQPIGDFRLPAALCDFIDWVARYTLSSPGAVLAQALRVPTAFEAEVGRRALAIGNGVPERTTRARERVLKLMADGLARMPSEAAREAGVTPSVVKALADAGALNRITPSTPSS
jgi:primosomal protein N' (replication factor Y)